MNPTGTDNEVATEVEPEGLPSPPKARSRVEDMPDEFFRLLQARQVMPGDVLADRYRLVEEVGDGAMGKVFIAEHLAIGRRVAVKVLKAELLTDPMFRARFQREAEAIASIAHRNVARFLDLFIGDPTFLVMEYVPGPTVAEVLRKEKKLDPLRASAIARRLCWALEAAHQAGLVHRDIKPANVILASDPETGEEPKLVDFGLAKVASSSSAQGLTRTGQIVGTPEYMSPEQIANKEIDARSDVYALGCLLYEMVAGRPPFTGHDDIQTLYQQLQTDPEPLAKHAPEAPRALWRLVRRALAKEPGARFRSMREMAEALAAIEAAAANAPDKTPHERTRTTTGGYRRGDSGVRTITGLRLSPRSLVLVGIALVAVALGGGFGLARLFGGAPGDRALIVLSRPAGATVEIDGRVLDEPTPTMARGLGEGAHTVRVRRGKLAAVERQVSLAPGERGVVSLILPPTSRRLEVRSVPEGAAVYLNGRLVPGETPTSVDVTEEDFHELRVEKSGYETAVRALTPDDRAPSITLSLPPETQPRGTLYVDAASAAEVWIDGVDSGHTTPTLGIQVPVGEHTVEVRAGEARAEAKVTIARGQTQRLVLNPTAPPH